MRLTKKAPLPSIGQSTDFMPSQTIENGLSPRRGYMPDNNNILDNDLVAEEEEEDAAYVSDTERELDLDGGYRTPTPPLAMPRRPSHPTVDPNNANRLSRSLDGIPENQPSRLQPLGQQKKYKSEPGRRTRGAGHHLPPMEKDIPDRPSAPRPTSGRTERPKSGYGTRPRSSQCRPKSGYGRRREPPRPSAPSPSVTPPPPSSQHDSDGSDPIDFIDYR